MRITTKGQVTIPLEVRTRLGLLPNSEVIFEVDGDSARIRKAPGTSSRGQRLLALMRDARPPKAGMTTDEIMAMTRGED
jgi:AbrB family looped-hinge helix DNA binding protein